MNYSSANRKSFNRNHMRIISGLVAILLVGLMVNGCGDSMKGSSKLSNQEQNSQNINGEAKAKLKSRDWRSQFKRGMSRSNKKMKDKDTGLQMIDYKFIGNISSSQAAKKLVNELLKSDSYFPVYNLTNLENFTLMKKSDIQNMKQTQNQKQYQFKNLRERLDNKIKKGDGEVLINWKYNGNEITTLAVVNEKHGFVYDNIASNILYAEYSSNTSSTKKYKSLTK